VDPTAAVENVKTFEQIRDDSLASRTFAMNLLVGFSVVGSVLTLVGLYGMLSLSVTSRRREFAIRTAIGAKQRDIHRLILGEGSRLIAGGIVSGLAIALLLSRVLKSFLFGVAPADPLTLIGMAAAFAAVAMRSPVGCRHGGRVRWIRWKRCGTSKSGGSQIALGVQPQFRSPPLRNLSAVLMQRLAHAEPSVSGQPARVVCPWKLHTGKGRSIQ
jgi:hypothetical protein